jgi:hypothetical protein
VRDAEDELRDEASADALLYGGIGDAAEREQGLGSDAVVL